MARRKSDYWRDVVLANAPQCVCSKGFDPHCPVNNALHDSVQYPEASALKYRVTAEEVRQHMRNYLAWCDEQGRSPSGEATINAITWKV